MRTADLQANKQLRLVFAAMLAAPGGSQAAKLEGCQGSLLTPGSPVGGRQDHTLVHQRATCAQAKRVPGMYCSQDALSCALLNHTRLLRGVPQL